MAERLASVFGTEKDKINCPFYYKMGACRHGERCSRQHIKPTFSQTLLMPHMYQSPARAAEISGVPPRETPEELLNHFEQFYYDMWAELSDYGVIEELIVCENVCEHLMGNTYVMFSSEEEAQTAYLALQGRFYDGMPVRAEYSPVTDFREARCRQHELSECRRGGYCNFMHSHPVSRDLYSATIGSTRRRHRYDNSPRRRRSRSRSPPRRRMRSRSPRRRRSPRRDDRYDGRGRRDDRDDRRDHHGESAPPSGWMEGPPPDIPVPPPQ